MQLKANLSNGCTAVLDFIVVRSGSLVRLSMAALQWWWTGCYHLSQHLGKWLKAGCFTHIHWAETWNSSPISRMGLKVTCLPAPLNNVQRREGELSRCSSTINRTWLPGSSMSFSWLAEPVYNWTKLWPKWCTYSVDEAGLLILV